MKTKYSFTYILLVMILVAVTVTGIALHMVERTAIKDVKTSLTEILNHRIAIIKAIYDKELNKDSVLYVLNQSNRNFIGIGKSHEFTIAENHNDTIVFLINQRNIRYEISKPMPYKNNAAIPLKRALAGDSGFIKDIDYRNVNVYAAYKYIPELKWGIVAKIDVDEVNKPIFFNFSIILFLSVLIAFIASLFYFKINNIIIHTLKDNEERLKLIIENTDTGYFFIDKKGIIKDVNDAWVKMYKYNSKDEIIGQHFYIVEKAEDIEMAKEFVEGIMNNDNRYLKGEFSRKCKDGSIGYHTFSAKPVVKNKETIGIEGFIIDSTDRVIAEQTIKKAERDLYESESKYKLLFDNMNEGVALHHLVLSESGKAVDYIIKDVNKSFEKEIGIPLEKAKDALATKLYNVSEAPYLEVYSKVAFTGEPYFFSTYFEPMDAYFDISVISPAKNWFATIFLNVTERKKSELVLKESEERYRSLFEHMLEGFAYCKMIYKNDYPEDFVYLTVNDAFETLTGLKDVEGKYVTDVIPGIRENDKELFELYNNVALTGKPQRFEIFVAALDDWYDISVYSPRKEYFVAVFDVITKRKKAEEALIKSETKYKNLVRDMQVGILIQGPKAEILLSNNKAFELLGLTKDQLLGKSSFDPDWNVIHEDGSSFPGPTHPVPQAIATLKPVENIIMGVSRPNGDRVWLLVTAMPQLNDDGEVEQVVCSFIDITMRKKAEEEIIVLNTELEQRVLQRTAQLEAANKELEAFSYSISHDLRSPLRAVDGFAKIILEEYSSVLDAEGQRLLTVITDNAKNMGGLIDDLLAFSRLNRQEIKPSLIEMKLMAKVVYHELTETIDSDNILFKIKDIPNAMGDPAMMRQVWRNLIGNAIKYSAPKKNQIIEIGATQENNETTYYIKDNGVGFDIAYVGKLFGVFQRLHSSKEFEGTGVGLAIVQRIIHRLNGRVRAEGTLNEGATFYFTIPNN